MAKNKIKIRRALISVSDTAHLAGFARRLSLAGIDIVATGSTQRFLQKNRIPARKVEDFTGMPEMMNGRVKTLHPKVHGGLLSGRAQDAPEVHKHGIEEIDLLVVNLYPFAATIARPDCTPDMAIENIDVGGPAMLRAAAKNHRFVAAVCDPADYARVMEEIDSGGGVSEDLRKALATKVFRLTADYDADVSRYLRETGAATPMGAPNATGATGEADDTTPIGATGATDAGATGVSGAAGTAGATDATDTTGAATPGEDTGEAESPPQRLHLELKRQSMLAYGENPHQKAAFYTRAGCPPAMTLRQGKPLSYNNIADATAAYLCVNELDAPACVIVKHATPCGAACGKTPADAYRRARRADELSAFGGIVALNCPIDEETAAQIVASQFTEAVIAPAADAAALRHFTDKPAMRVLTCLPRTNAPLQISVAYDGFLVQESDSGQFDKNACQVVTARPPTEDEWRDLLFAWRVVGHVKSNAIVMARALATVGIGGGQPNRVGAVALAAQAMTGDKTDNEPAVMASDAFFPFRDGPDAAHKANVTAIIQPGGSVRDNEITAVANEHGMAMVFTGTRRFKH